MRRIAGLFFALAVCASTVAAATGDFGRIEGADYRLDVPQNWNRELIVFYHG